MIEEIANNLVNFKDYNFLESIVKENDVEAFVQNNYLEIMNEWIKKYDMFDIPSGMISIKIGDDEYYIPVGKKQYDKNTIFDIASMTKFYTECILFDVLDDYNINLDNRIKSISKNYKNIENLTLLDLISFNNTYKTDGDTRTCETKEEALRILRTSHIIEEKSGQYLYTDLPIMILTDILEEFTGLTYKELFDKYIIKKYKLHDTYLNIDNNERYVTNNPTYINDPKANIMGGYYGHAGVKTTSIDFMKFIYNSINSKYKNLYFTPSSTLNEDGSRCIKKAIMGNLNLYVPGESAIPSKYLPKMGFAIQGSVRCHSENMIFNINGKEYQIASSIFLDLYTDLESIKKYE